MCRSAFDALMAGRRVEVVARFDRYREALLFCPACAAKVDLLLAADEWTLDDDAENFEFEGYLAVECIACLEPRLAAVGLPAVRALLDEERLHQLERRVKPPMPYELYQFFAEGFGERWASEAASPDGVIDAYLAAHPREACEELANWVDAVAASLPDELALQRVLRERLDCCHVPAGGARPAHDWLGHVSRRLRGQAGS